MADGAGRAAELAAAVRAGAPYRGIRRPGKSDKPGLLSGGRRRHRLGAADAPAVEESGSVHTNLGATATVTLTLPASAPEGTMFTFAIQATQELRVDPAAAAIRDDSGQTSGKYKAADAVGECLTLVADSNGDWTTVAKNGTWTEEV